MCLYITNRARAKIAKKDIRCYKIILKDDLSSNQFYTFYQFAPVAIGETYNSKIVVRTPGIIDEALHSFVMLKETQYFLANFYPYYRKCGRSIHIAECIIPKGATYYLGDFEGQGPSYASDAITYVKLKK